MIHAFYSSRLVVEVLDERRRTQEGARGGLRSNRQAATMAAILRRWFVGKQTVKKAAERTAELQERLSDQKSVARDNALIGTAALLEMAASSDPVQRRLVQVEDAPGAPGYVRFTLGVATNKRGRPPVAGTKPDVVLPRYLVHESVVKACRLWASGYESRNHGGAPSSSPAPAAAALSPPRRPLDGAAAVAGGGGGGGNWVGGSDGDWPSREWDNLEHDELWSSTSDEDQRWLLDSSTDGLLPEGLEQPLLPVFTTTTEALDESLEQLPAAAPAGAASFGASVHPSDGSAGMWPPHGSWVGSLPGSEAAGGSSAASLDTAARLADSTSKRGREAAAAGGVIGAAGGEPSAKASRWAEEEEEEGGGTTARRQQSSDSDPLLPPSAQQQEVLDSSSPFGRGKSLAVRATRLLLGLFTLKFFILPSQARDKPSQKLKRKAFCAGQEHHAADGHSVCLRCRGSDRLRPHVRRCSASSERWMEL